MTRQTQQLQTDLVLKEKIIADLIAKSVQIAEETKLDSPKTKLRSPLTPAPQIGRKWSDQKLIEINEKNFNTISRGTSSITGDIPSSKFFTKQTLSNMELMQKGLNNLISLVTGNPMPTNDIDCAFYSAYGDEL